MSLLQELTSILSARGLKTVVLSPGSRNAPLALMLIRHPSIHTYTVSDERSAAFIALGMAQELHQPVGVLCTSGTAALNYGPAIAEAWYQNVPLVMMSADRPPEWLDQQDGQTINQHNLFPAFLKKTFEFPVDTEHPDTAWYFLRMGSEAVNKALAAPMGPVHLNLPFREPLYEDHLADASTTDAFKKTISVSNYRHELPEKTWDAIFRKLNQYQKILIAGGQHSRDLNLISALKKVSEEKNIPVVSDVTGNLSGNAPTLRHHDLILENQDEAAARKFAPELLITFGDAFISKNLKLFLRKYPPKDHWQIQPHENAADPMQSLRAVIPLTAKQFFQTLGRSEQFIERQPNFKKTWEEGEKRAANMLQNAFKNQPFTEFEAVRNIIDRLPENANLHLANSMPVRYANYGGAPSHVTTWGNRGTSGIDGCLSTAAGHALAGNKENIALLGDLAFFYDRNGLWHNHPLTKLKIILLNNHGGGIFRIIDGPRQQPELEEYFETQQALNAENTAKDFQMEYFHAADRETFLEVLPRFFSQEKAAIFEVETDSQTNAELFRNFKEQIKKLYAND